MRPTKAVCIFLTATWLAALAQTCPAQTLVYMVSYGNTSAGFRAKYSRGIFPIHPKTLQEQIAMSRRTIKNEIWAVSLTDGKRTRLFSDEDTNFELTPAVDMGHSPFANGSAYLRGVERTLKKVPQQAIPNVHETPQGVYEVSLDGSNHFRRLFDATQNMSGAMVNATGTRVAFWGVEDKGGYFLYVHELPSGNLLARANITKILQAHCGGCLPLAAGWLSDGKTLYFTMEEGDEDDAPDDAAADVPGTYLVSDQGASLGGLPVHAGDMNLPDYTREISNAPFLIAQTKDGDFVFRDYGEKKGPQPKPPVVLDGMLVLAGPDFKIRKQIPLSRRAATFALAPDGNFLAFVEDRELPNYTSERHIWALNLQTGEEKELFVAPPPNPPTSLTPNESAFILGWLRK